MIDTDNNEAEKKKNPSIPITFKTLEIKSGEWPVETDFYERHKEIENLSPIVLNADSPLVFAIDGPWGMGKTTFIELWQYYLDLHDMQSIYINAWEHDFSEDPLLPMLSALDNWVNQQTKDNKNKPISKIWEGIKNITPGLLKSSAIAAAKLGTFGALDLEKEYEKVLADFAGDNVNNISNLIDNYQLKKSVLDKFKNDLNLVLETLPENQPNLIIFVDELDRCKPTFAVDMLERIKHLFDIKKIVFVLSINRDQLSKTVQGIYGSKFDGINYLKRFIEFDYQLNEIDNNRYINSLFKHKDIEQFLNNRSRGYEEYSTIHEMFNFVAKKFKLPPRDINQIVTRFRLIMRSIRKKQRIDTPILFSLLLLRHLNIELYNNYINDIFQANNVIEFLYGLPDTKTILPTFYPWVAGALIRTGNSYDEEHDLTPLINFWEELIRDWAEDSSHPNFSKIQLVYKYSKSDDSFWLTSSMRKLAYGRIELTNKIDISY